VAVVLERRHISHLIAAVAPDYYVSESMMLDALEHGTSFNLVHDESAMKVDVLVLTDDPLDRRQITRREAVELDTGDVIWVGAPDDQVLRKLFWFRAGGHVSDRQWRDVIAILTVQGERIDRAELQRTADELGLGDLVARAIAEADDSAIP
jgi:hypothetical protein